MPFMLATSNPSAVLSPHLLSLSMARSVERQRLAAFCTSSQTGRAILPTVPRSPGCSCRRERIDGGANIEIPDGSIGTPLDNAIGYACWNVARLLVARGVKIDKLWHAAALGLLTRLTELADEEPQSAELSKAFWHACAGGQRRAAEYLLLRGADLNWVPDYAEGTPLDAANGLGTRQENVISWLREKGARSAESG